MVMQDRHDSDRRQATLTIAASDSSAWSRRCADYVCDGVDDHVQIQAAIDALPATGGEVFLLDGRYNIEVALVLDSYQTLRGCGRNTILTTTTAGLTIITATGGSGTERIGILITDLCIDGNAGGVAGNYGIVWTYVNYSEICNIWCQDNALEGIDLVNCCFNTVIGNICQGNGADAIILDGDSDGNVVSGNVCRGNDYGIYLWEADGNIINGNTCDGNTEAGIDLDASNNNVIIANTLSANGYHGIILSDSSNNIISGNFCQGNGVRGIRLELTSNDNIISGNTCIGNSQAADNTYDNIDLNNSSYNLILGNLCRDGGGANQPRYGIHLENDTCVENVVKENDLYDSGRTAPFNDIGTGTKLNVYVVLFSDGSDSQDSGFLIDADTEYARAWLRLPPEVQQAVRMKVYARSGVLEADHMRAEFVIYGGADNEGYQTHNGSVANHPSTSADFAADDVIYWTITEAGVLALLGGDSIEVKVLHEALGNGDCATNAYMRTVEIEYV